MNNLDKKINGFFKFAWIPVELTNKKTAWLTNVFYAGLIHGVKNRYATGGEKKYELKYLI